MNLLVENELVRKYFGCDEKAHACANCQMPMAYRVLQAMQEPINRGERFLYWDGQKVVERGDYPLGCELNHHPNYLRLPSAHQPKAESGTTYTCCAANCPCISHREPKAEKGTCDCHCHIPTTPCPGCNQKPDLVEEKIQFLLQGFKSEFALKSWSKELRELVQLARGSQ